MSRSGSLLASVAIAALFLTAATKLAKLLENRRLEQTGHFVLRAAQNEEITQDSIADSAADNLSRYPTTHLQQEVESRSGVRQDTDTRGHFANRQIPSSQAPAAGFARPAQALFGYDDRITDNRIVQQETNKQSLRNNNKFRWNAEQDDFEILDGESINFEDLLPSLDESLPDRLIHEFRPLLVHEASRAALSNNLTLQLEAVSPDIERAALIEAQAEFEPVLNFDASRAAADQSATIAGQPETTVDTTLDIQVPNRLGGVLEFTNETMLQRVVDEIVGITPVIRYTQSLLQGGGKPSNLALIRAAELSTTAAERQVEFTAIETVGQVETAYWNLWFQQMNLRATAWTVRAARENLRLINVLVRSKIRIRSDQYRTFSTLKQFEAALTQATEDTRIAERDLKELILLPDANVDSQISFALAESSLILSGSSPNFDRDELVRLALSQRPDLKGINFALDSIDQELIRARNDRLPQLDLFVEGTFDSQTTGGVLDNDQTINQVNFGLSTVLPLKGNLAAKAAIRELLAQKNQTLIEREQLSVAIVAGINDAVEQLERSFERVKLSEKAAFIAIELYRLEFDLLKPKQGRAAVKTADADFLFQITQNAGQALTDLFQAQTDYRIAETNLLVAIGSLLSARNLIWTHRRP